MAILNYTTSIDVHKTVSEVQRILARGGAQKTVVDHRNGLPVALTFSIEVNGATMGFVLPCNSDGVLTAMLNDRKVPRRLCTDEQALRVSWRIVKDWVEAQLAIVASGMTDLAEVFLPYAITKDGSTLYRYMLGEGQRLLSH
jgi:hypothetical protein